MEFSEEDLSEVVRSVWDAMLGLTLVPADQPYETADDERCLTGCVQITGSWEGAVMIDLPEQLAREAAAAMFGCEPDEAGLEELQDAVGEIANMTGGNLKALLPEPSSISLPSVTEHSDYTADTPGEQIVTQLAFDCRGDPIQVTLLRKRP